MSNRHIFFSLALLAWGGPAAAVPARIMDGLTAEWHLDSVFPLVNLVADTSGNGYHGRVTSAAAGSSGWYNNGLNLRGGRYVTVPAGTNLGRVGTGSFSVSAWIKLTSSGPSIRSIIENRGTDGRGYHFAVYNNTQLLLQLADSAGFTNYISTDISLTMNRWQHVGVVVNRSYWPLSIKFVVDGFATGTIFTPRLGDITNTTVPFYLGYHKDWGASYGLNDRLDEVHVYNRPLETWEMWTVMNPGHPTFQPAFWNGSRIGSNNCYNYTSNKATNTFAQPGRASGAPFTSLTCASVKAAAIADGYEPISGYPSYVLDFKSGAALVVAPGVDYHWYRLDENGTWTHKPGGTSATNRDNSGNTITDPRTANRGVYTDFCGFFYNWSDIAEGYGHENVN
jgi:hypothetical protein